MSIVPTEEFRGSAGAASSTSTPTGSARQRSPRPHQPHRPQRSRRTRLSAAASAAAGAIAVLAVLKGVAPLPVAAQQASTLIVSEVHPGGSGNGTYNADWFEVTNTGTTPVDITGWKMDDSSNASATSVPLQGVTSIAPGQSVVFLDATTPVNIGAFTTAWFGATPPAGLVIGTYGGSGVGLSTSGDAVNLFDAAGTRVTGISFGNAPASATFDNAAGLGSATPPPPLVTTVSVAGVNGAMLSANGAETGSPGRRANPSSAPLVDLSTYVRIGRYDLPEPTRTPAPPDSVLAQEVSAVTYNWDTDTLFVVGDGGSSVVQVSKTGQLIDSMTLARGGSPQGTAFYDPEGLAYIGHGQFVLAEERDRQVVRFTYAAGTTLTRDLTQTVKLGTFVDNIGIEGITYDPLTGGFIAVKEIDPQGLFLTQIDFAAGTATNGSPTTVNSTNLFDFVPPFANLLDFADIYALSNLSLTGPGADHLLVLSQESAKILDIDRTGRVYSALTILSDPGNPLSVAAQQHEGLTMDRDGFLYVVSENGGGDFDHPQLWVYGPSSVPNAAPTALTLTNVVSTLAENSNTATRLKVADIEIADDGLGTNVIAVTGADAAAFEADSSGLYIKAGTSLDFETQSSYSVTVTVDDATVGATPDASADYTLTLTDVEPEVPAGSALVITEVAPWGSGDSPYASDWFEVTNTGTAAVSLAGWRMDDSSNTLASAVPLTGIASIAPGESVIFLETGSAAAAFRQTWFGANVPAGLQIGGYTGGGVGLSTGGDAVNLFDAGGVPRASVTFGAAPSNAPFATFDNTARLNNAVLTVLSAPGVNGAFVAANDVNEIGSPGSVGPAGRLVITEVAPWSSGNSPFGADWFEVTNVGGSSVDITGWKVDDNSESPAAAVALNGITQIAPGESVIFLEAGNLESAAAAFRSTWFGAHPPAGLQIGNYSGGGVGLSTGGDAVNLYDSAGILRAKVFFGASPTGPTFATFDNAAGANNAAITQLSVPGANGAFVAVNDATEIGSPGATAARVVISEVAPWSSGDSPVGADWFEVTNTGSVAVDLTGWKMDDNSNAAANAVALRGVSSLAPGESVIFIESTADGSADAALLAGFATAWTGSAVLPAGRRVGFYGGSGVGLSTGGDAVNLFDALGSRITGVAFGASVAGLTFDNAAGRGSRALPLPLLSTLSAAGVAGAFRAADGLETGSPWSITADTLAPVLAPLTNLATSTTGTSAIVTFAPVATDNVSQPANIGVLCQPASGSAFAIGVTTVSCLARDEAGNSSSPATFTVTVTRIIPNVPPTAAPDSARTLEATAVTIDVLANDSDADRDPLTLASVGAPAHGTAAIAAGRVVYTPAAGFYGTDTFTYGIADGRGGASTGTVTVQVSRLGRFVALSRDLTWLRLGSRVLTGDVGAIEARLPGHRDNDIDDGGRNDVTMRVGIGASMRQPSSRVVGDTVLLHSLSSIYHVVDNTLRTRILSTIRGTQTGPMIAPFVAMPAFPSVQPGTLKVTVPKQKSSTLAPGAYGAVQVAAGATLILDGGLYQMESLEVAASGTVLFRGPTELRIRTGLETRAKARLALDPAVSGLRASQVVIYVAGRDEDCRRVEADDDGDDAGAVSVHIGAQNVVQANIYAARGTVWLKSRTRATGAFLGVHVRIGIDAELTLDSAFQ